MHRFLLRLRPTNPAETVKIWYQYYWTSTKTASLQSSTINKRDTNTNNNKAPKRLKPEIHPNFDPLFFFHHIFWKTEQSLEFSSGKLFMCAWGNEEEWVDNGGNGRTNEGTEPIDPVVVPAPANNSGTKGDSGVHGCTVESATDQDVGTHDETNCNGCNNTDVALLGINSGGVDCVNQTEGHHDLKNDCVPCALAGGQRKCGCCLQHHNNNNINK